MVHKLKTLEELKAFEIEAKSIDTKEQLAELLKRYKKLSKPFGHVTFPVVRRVFSSLISNEIVSVQPMSLPSGLLFHLDYSYGTNSTGSLKPEEK
jgi:hypothetical protein